jgi:hypothetical protein
MVRFLLQVISILSADDARARGFVLQLKYGVPRPNDNNDLFLALP